MSAAGDEVLPGPLRAALDRTVTPPEVVRWAGRPGPVRDDIGEWLTVFVGWGWILAAASFTTFLAYLAHFGPNPDPQASPAWTLFVSTVFVGIGVLPARSLNRKRKRRANTVYAVTDRRAVIIETWWAGWWSWWRTPAAQSFGPADLGKLRRVDHPAGRGDVVLAERVDGDGHVELDAFWNVAAAGDVEAVVRELVARTEPAGVQQPHE